MQAVLEWMKGVVILFVILTALMYLVPQKQYKKYVQFFVEMIIVIAVISPVAKIVYANEDFSKKIEYTEFWQEMENLQKDVSKMEFMQSDYYIEQYEKAIADDITLMAENQGFSVKSADVTLSESYELQSVELQVAKAGAENDITIGKIIVEKNEAICYDLKQEIHEFYQLDDEKIRIWYVGE